MKNNEFQLTELDLDILKEISNIGIGNASIALSKILDSKIDLTVPLVTIDNVLNVTEFIDKKNKYVAGVFFKILGDSTGDLIMVLPKDSAFLLIQLLLQKEISSIENLTEIDFSAIRELGNIITSAYLSALSNMLHLSLYPSVPGLAIDSSEHMMKQALKVLDREATTSLILESKFKEEKSGVNGHVFLLLDKESVHKIITAAKELFSS